MSETLTGRTRLRPAREYSTDVLVLQVEISTGEQDTDTGADCRIWRDAKVEDLTIGIKVVIET